MNRIYRLVFNRELGVMQVASELASATTGTGTSVTTRALSRKRLLAVCLFHALALGTIGSASAANADAAVFHGNTTLSDTRSYPDGIVVGRDEDGTLRIVNGGHVTAAYPSSVGEQQGVVGNLIVDGANAWFAPRNGSQPSRFALVVGELGEGNLSVLNGGRVGEEGSSQQFAFGLNAGSRATLLVDGPGSSLYGNYLAFGRAGQGSATVSNGGKIINNRTTFSGMEIAEEAGSSFQFDVVGAGSEVTANSGVVMGNNGTAILNIKEGGAFNAGYLQVAGTTSASGDIIVDGVGSSLSVTKMATFANAGDFSLTVTNGAVVTAGALWTSYESGSTSSLLVDGAGSKLLVNGTSSLANNGDGSLLVGRSGTSDLTISNGAEVEVRDAMIGTSGGSNGSIIVYGPSSKLTASRDITVGDNGKAELTIRNGGQVSAASMLVSDAGLSSSTATTGKVLVDGSGSSLVIAGTGDLVVGGTGTGTLEVTNGGHVSAGSMTVGLNPGRVDTPDVVSVSGAGSALDVTGELLVGRETPARFQVLDGAKVTVGSLNQDEGKFQSDTLTGGIVQIDGLGTELVAGNLSLTSPFTMTGGASVVSDTATFSNAPGFDGVASISGSGTEMNVSGALTLDGSLDIFDGASVRAGSLGLDYDFYASRGVKLHVRGAGSSFTSAGDIVLQAAGGIGVAGVLQLSDGGLVKVGSNRILVGTGSQLAFGADQAAQQALSAGQLDAAVAVELDGSGALVLNHTGDIELGNTFASTGYNTEQFFDGSLVSKAGTTRLSGDLHAFNGDINVQGGKLVIAGDLNTAPTALSVDGNVGEDLQEIQVTGTGALVLDGKVGYGWQFSTGSSINTRASTSILVGAASDGDAPMLAGSGSVIGDVRVGHGGVISPGDGDVGMFTINGNLSFVGNILIGGTGTTGPGIYAVDVKGDGSSDLLTVSGTASLREAGTSALPAEVRVTGLDPATSYQNGQQYTILTAANGVQGEFGGVSSSSAFLTPTLRYDANNVFLSLGLSIAEVGSGQLLAGNGSYGSTRILSGGTVSPGDASAPIGAISFSDVSFAKGSFYDVDLKGTGVAASTASIRPAAVSTVNDVINVSGVATLDGGTVQVTALDPQASYQNGHSYTILSAQGGVNGTFDGSTSRSAFLTTELSYAANDVMLKIGVTPADGGGGGGGGNGGGNGGGTTPPAPPPVFGTVASTYNHFAVAGALDTLPQVGESLALYNQLLMLTADQARAAYGQLSGEGHAAMRSALVENRFLRDGVQHRLDGRGGDAASGPFSAWVAGSGVSRQLDSDGNGAAADVRRQGVMAGVDWSMGDALLLGAAVGTEDIDQTMSSLETRNDADATHAGLYASTQWQGLSLTAGVDYSKYDLRTQRQARIGSAAVQSLHSTHDAKALSARLQAGWTFEWSGTALTPYVEVAHTRLETDAFSEAGGSAALAVAESKDELLSVTTGARFVWDISAGEIDDAHLIAGLAWQNNSGELVADSRSQFLAGGQGFTVLGASLPRNLAVAELGVAISPSDRSRLSLTAQGRAGDGLSEFGAQANWSISF